MTNFFNDNSLPEIKLTIFNYLPPRMRIKAQSVSKEWQQLLKNKSLWQKSLCPSYDNFVERVKKLPIDLQDLVAQEIYTVPFAEEVAMLYQLDMQERLNKMVNENELNLGERQTLCICPPELTLSNNILQAFHEKLMTVKAYFSMPFQHFLHLATSMSRSKACLFALREKAISLPEMLTLEDNYLGYLLTSPGLSLLRKKLITLEDIKAMPGPDYLFHMFFENGDDYFRNKTNYRYLEAIFSKLVSPKQIIALPDSSYIPHLFSKNGVTALKEKLITPEQVAALPNEKYLELVLTNSGLEKLRNGRISLEDMSALPNIIALQKMLTVKSEHKRCNIL